ncbi:MAG: hypothetical protein WC552_02255, partial [Candidatus Omnitrophota bacterium]
MPNIEAFRNAVSANPVWLQAVAVMSLAVVSLMPRRLEKGRESKTTVWATTLAAAGASVTAVLRMPAQASIELGIVLTIFSAAYFLSEYLSYKAGAYFSTFERGRRIWSSLDHRPMSLVERNKKAVRALGYTMISLALLLMVTVAKYRDRIVRIIFAPSSIEKSEAPAAGTKEERMAEKPAASKAGTNAVPTIKTPALRDFLARNWDSLRDKIIARASAGETRMNEIIRESRYSAEQRENLFKLLVALSEFKKNVPEDNHFTAIWHTNFERLALMIGEHESHFIWMLQLENGLGRGPLQVEPQAGLCILTRSIGRSAAVRNVLGETWAQRIRTAWTQRMVFENAKKKSSKEKKAWLTAKAREIGFGQSLVTDFKISLAALLAETAGLLSSTETMTTELLSQIAKDKWNTYRGKATPGMYASAGQRVGPEVLAVRARAAQGAFVTVRRFFERLNSTPRAPRRNSRGRKALSARGTDRSGKAASAGFLGRTAAGRGNSSASSPIETTLVSEESLKDKLRKEVRAIIRALSGKTIVARRRILRQLGPDFREVREPNDEIKLSDLIQYAVYRRFTRWLLDYVAKFNKTPSPQQRQREMEDIVSSYLGEIVHKELIARRIADIEKERDEQISRTAGKEDLAAIDAQYGSQITDAIYGKPGQLALVGLDIAEGGEDEAWFKDIILSVENADISKMICAVLPSGSGAPSVTPEEIVGQAEAAIAGICTYYQKIRVLSYQAINKKVLTHPEHNQHSLVLGRLKGLYDRLKALAQMAQSRTNREPRITPLRINPAFGRIGKWAIVGFGILAVMTIFSPAAMAMDHTDSNMDSNADLSPSAIFPENCLGMDSWEYAVHVMSRLESKDGKRFISQDEQIRKKQEAKKARESSELMEAQIKTFIEEMKKDAEARERVAQLLAKQAQTARTEAARPATPEDDQVARFIGRVKRIAEAKDDEEIRNALLLSAGEGNKKDVRESAREALIFKGYFGLQEPYEIFEKYFGDYHTFARVFLSVSGQTSGYDSKYVADNGANGFIPLTQESWNMVNRNFKNWDYRGALDLEKNITVAAKIFEGLLVKAAKENPGQSEEKIIQKALEAFAEQQKLKLSVDDVMAEFRSAAAARPAAKVAVARPAIQPAAAQPASRPAEKAAEEPAEETSRELKTVLSDGMVSRPVVWEEIKDCIISKGYFGSEESFKIFQEYFGGYARFARFFLAVSEQASRYNPYYIALNGARGFIPLTEENWDQAAKSFGGWNYRGALDLEKNITIAAKIFENLLVKTAAQHPGEAKETILRLALGAFLKGQIPDLDVNKVMAAFNDGNGYPVSAFSASVRVSEELSVQHDDKEVFSVQASRDNANRFKDDSTASAHVRTAVARRQGQYPDAHIIPVIRVSQLQQEWARYVQGENDRYFTERNPGIVILTQDNDGTIVRWTAAGREEPLSAEAQQKIKDIITQRGLSEKDLGPKQGAVLAMTSDYTALPQKEIERILSRIVDRMAEHYGMNARDVQLLIFSGESLERFRESPAGEDSALDVGRVLDTLASGQFSRGDSSADYTPQVIEYNNHTYLKIPVPVNSGIYSNASGEVVRAGLDETNHYVVTIRTVVNGKILENTFAHLKVIQVKLKDKVTEQSFLGFAAEDKNPSQLSYVLHQFTLNDVEAKKKGVAALDQAITSDPKVEASRQGMLGQIASQFSEVSGQPEAKKNFLAEIEKINQTIQEREKEKTIVRAYNKEYLLKIAALFAEIGDEQRTMFRNAGMDDSDIEEITFRHTSEQKKKSDDQAKDRQGLIYAMGQAIAAAPAINLRARIDEMEKITASLKENGASLKAYISAGYSPQNNIPFLSRTIGSKDVPIDIGMLVDFQGAEFIELLNMGYGAKDLFHAQPLLVKTLGWVAYVSALTDLFNKFQLARTDFGERGGIMFLSQETMVNWDRFIVDWTTRVVSDPEIIAGQDGKPNVFSGTDGATLLRITLMRLVQDLPRKIFGWLPLVGSLFGDFKEPAVWDVSQFPAIYFPGKAQVAFMLKALKNQDRNFIYTIERGRKGETIEVDGKKVPAENFVRGFRYDLGRLKSSKGTEGRDEFFRACCYGDPRIEKFMSDPLNPLAGMEPGKISIVPSQHSLENLQKLYNVRQGYDEQGNTILAADLDLLTGEILDIYYDRLPATAKQKVFKRVGMDTYTESRAEATVNTGKTFGEIPVVNKDGTTTMRQAHPIVIFSQEAARLKYFLSHTTTPNETAHVLIFGENGAYLRTERMTASTEEIVRKIQPLEKERILYPESDKVSLPAGTGILAYPDGAIGVLIPKPSRVPLAVVHLAGRSIYLYSETDLNGLITRDQAEGLEVKMKWTLADKTVIAETTTRFEKGQSPARLILAGLKLNSKDRAVGILEFGANLREVNKEILGEGIYGFVQDKGGEIKILNEETGIPLVRTGALSVPRTSRIDEDLAEAIRDINIVESKSSTVADAEQEMTYAEYLKMLSVQILKGDAADRTKIDSLCQKITELKQQNDADRADFSQKKAKYEELRAKLQEAEAQLGKHSFIRSAQAVHRLLVEMAEEEEKLAAGLNIDRIVEEIAFAAGKDKDALIRELKAEDGNIEDALRRAIDNRFSTTPYFLSQDAAAKLGEKITKIDRAIQVLNNFKHAAANKLSVVYKFNPVQDIAAGERTIKKIEADIASTRAKLAAKDFKNLLLRREGPANTNYDPEEFSNIKDGFKYLRDDDGQAAKNDGKVMGRIRRLREMILPYWRVQVGLSRGHTEWHRFTQDMFKLQEDWLAFEQHQEWILDSQSLAYEASDKIGSGVGFRTPYEILAEDYIRSQERKINLLKENINMLGRSENILAPNYAGLPLIPLEIPKNPNADVDLTDIYTIQQSRDYWLVNDNDPAAKLEGVMGRLDRIKKGIEYFKETIKSGRLSDKAQKLLKQFIGNLEFETQYYIDFAEDEINKDEAFQLAVQSGNEPAEMDKEIIARKKAARGAEKEIYVQRKSIVEQLLALGINIYNEKLAGDIQKIADFERRNGHRALNTVLNRMGSGRNPLEGITAQLRDLLGAQQDEQAQRKFYQKAKAGAEQQRETVEIALNAQAISIDKYNRTLAELKEYTLRNLARSSRNGTIDRDTKEAVDVYFAKLSRAPPVLTQIGDRLYFLNSVRESRVLLNGRDSIALTEVGFTNQKHGYRPTFQQIAVSNLFQDIDIYAGSLQADNRGAAQNRYVFLNVTLTEEDTAWIMNKLLVGGMRASRFNEEPLSTRRDPKGKNSKQDAILVMDSIGLQGDRVFFGLVGLIKVNTRGQDTEQKAVQGVLDLTLSETTHLKLEMGYADATSHDRAQIKIIDTLTGQEYGKTVDLKASDAYDFHKVTLRQDIARPVNDLLGKVFDMFTLDLSWNRTNEKGFLGLFEDETSRFGSAGLGASIGKFAFSAERGIQEKRAGVSANFGPFRGFYKNIKGVESFGGGINLYGDGKDA